MGVLAAVPELHDHLARRAATSATATATTPGRRRASAQARAARRCRAPREAAGSAPPPSRRAPTTPPRTARPAPPPHCSELVARESAGARDHGRRRPAPNHCSMQRAVDAAEVDVLALVAVGVEVGQVGPLADHLSGRPRADQQRGPGGAVIGSVRSRSARARRPNSDHTCTSTRSASPRASRSAWKAASDWAIDRHARVERSRLRRMGVELGVGGQRHAAQRQPGGEHRRQAGQALREVGGRRLGVGDRAGVGGVPVRRCGTAPAPGGRSRPRTPPRPPARSPPRRSGAGHRPAGRPSRASVGTCRPTPRRATARSPRACRSRPPGCVAVASVGFICAVHRQPLQRVVGAAR